MKMQHLSCIVLSLCLTVPALAAEPPSISSVDPSSGRRGESLAVRIYGENLTDVTGLNFGDNVTVDTFTIDSDSQITANITIREEASIGPHDLWVYTPDFSTHKTGAFQVLPGVPVVGQIVPYSGRQAESLMIWVYGHNFTDATGVSFGTGVAVNGFTIDSDSQIRVNISIAKGAGIGPRDVTVSTPEFSGTKSNGFQVVSGTPVIDAVSPSSGRQAQSLAVMIMGANLTGATAVSFGAGVTVNSFTVDSDSVITANISIAQTAEVGPRDVTVTVPPFGDAKFVEGFSVGSGSVSLPTVSTKSATDVGATHASLNGKLDSDGGEACEYRFRYWQEGQAGRFTPWRSSARTGTTFSMSVSVLTPATTYHYVAEARNSAGTAAGDAMIFTTGVRLVILPSEGGRVVEPATATVELLVPGDVHVLAQADPNYYFWCWKGTAAGSNEVKDVGDPNTTVFVNGDDTLLAAFLPITDSRDDLDPAPCRGSVLSTSQQWDFGDGAGATPQDLYKIGGVPRNGRVPLPGTQIKPLASALAEENQWWATDMLWGSDREGLLALPALQCLLYVWPSMDTTTTVRVQCVWHAYDENEPNSADSQPLVILEDLNPPSLVQDTVLEQGWHNTTYTWTVSPSPKATSFLLHGRIVVDTLIIDTCTEQTRAVIHVDDNAPLDPGPNDITVSDPLEDGSPEHPFDSIQEGISAVAEQGTVIVHAGRYTETIHLPAKNITITAEWLADPSILAPSILDADGNGPAVTFGGSGTANCRLEGLTIIRGKSPTAAAILCEHASPVICHCLISGNMATAPNGAVVVCRDSKARFINCTISGNRTGAAGAVLSFADSRAVVLNSILWGNDGSVLAVESGLAPQILYSDIEAGAAGLGVLDSDPFFAKPGYWQDNGTSDPNDDTWVEGDYHLQSRQGRLDPKTGTWVPDVVSSPCIDAGDPESLWYQEPEPNGGRIDMGAYGGTWQASLSNK